jgi:hypothetical protein
MPSLLKALQITNESGALAEATVESTRWLVAVFALVGTLWTTSIAGRWRRIAIDREKGRLATSLAISICRAKLMYTQMTLQQLGELIGSYQAELIKVDSAHGTFEGADISATASAVTP